MFNSHQSEMCANKARQHYTPMGQFFAFTPIKMKLNTMKLPMKSTFFCITSLNTSRQSHQQVSMWENVGKGIIIAAGEKALVSLYAKKMNHWIC